MSDWFCSLVCNSCLVAFIHHDPQWRCKTTCASIKNKLLMLRRRVGRYLRFDADDVCVRLSRCKVMAARFINRQQVVLALFTFAGQNFQMPPNSAIGINRPGEERCQAKLWPYANLVNVVVQPANKGWRWNHCRPNLACLG